MIVLEKKRILVTIGIALCAMFVFTIQMANTNKNLNTIQTVALPVSNKTIVIDAGHGVPDEGAQSSNRNNRSGNKFKNSIKITKFIGAIR